MNLKTCTKCKKELPATLEFFYRNTGGKYGVTPRCKPCVNEDNTESLKKQIEKEPELVKALANARVKRHYYKNIEESQKRAREFAAKTRANPEKYEKIKARKRGGGAGITTEQLEEIFQSQGCVCACCGTDEPQGIVGSNGWNVDHCHTTGMVRFILCPSCNKGLGGFKDNPQVMRKAADLIESFYDSQQKATIKT